MKLRHSLAILAVALLAACSSDDSTTTRRTTSSGTGANNNNNGGTNGGTTGGSTDGGAVTVTLSAPTAGGNVGTPLQVIATVTVGANPVTDGTTVTFTSVPNTNITYSVAGGTVQTVAGKASLTVDSSLAQVVSVSATALGVASSAVDLNFTPAPAPKAKTITVTFGASTIQVSDPLSNRDTTIVYVNVIGDDDMPWQGTVNLTASDGSLVQTSLTTDASGNAQTTYNASTKLGTVTIKASASGTEGSATLTVGPAAPLTIEAVSTEPGQIGVAGSDTVETSTVTFKVTDKFGNPVSDATLVSFKVVPSLGGVSITPASGGLYTVGGLVSPVVKSGYKSGTVRVIATIGAPFVASPITASSNSITIFGALPDAISFDLSIDPAKVVVSGYDMNGIQVPFTISLTDNYGNPVRPGTPVSVYCSEGGICGTNDEKGILTDSVGHATFVFQTAFTNKLWSTATTQGLANFGSGIGTSHTWPAMFSDQNGRVRVTVAALGRTSWYDADQDGVFDVGETIAYDPPEPFEDFNGNGTRDTAPFEPYVDELFSGVTGAHFTAGVYNTHTEGGGASFHAQQTIWTKNDVIYSAGPVRWYVPEFIDDADSDGKFTEWTDMPIVGDYTAGAVNPTAIGFSGLVTSSTTIEFYVGDINGHALPPGSTLKVTLDDSTMPLEVKSGEYTVPNGGAYYTTWPVTIRHTGPGVKKMGGVITRLNVEYTIKDLNTKVMTKVPVQVY